MSSEVLIECGASIFCAFRYYYFLLTVTGLLLRILTSYDADDKIWKAMIIMAWDGGDPSSVFGANVFKKVLSVFITAAIMKLGQGWSVFVLSQVYLSD